MNDFVLTGAMPQFIDSANSNPLARYRPLTDWLDARYEFGVDPYSKFTVGRTGPVMSAHGRKGDVWQGINLGSQDYLNLSTHETVLDAARTAIDEYGVHSAGSAALMGNTAASLALEEKIAAFTGYADCTIFPTGWGAGYGIVRALAKEDDHVVIDLLAHGCLHEGARAATKNVHVFPHLSNDGVEQRLARIRKSDSQNAIIVVTESTFSMDSDVPDMEPLQEICRKYGAILIVDCAHDLGAIAKDGGGYLELQNYVGKVDVLMGSFSKTFASNGGFVATNATELKLAIRYSVGPSLFSNTISPVNAASVAACFDIVASQEGAALREKLLSNVRYLRAELKARNFEVLGRDSAIVPVILGDNRISRLTTRNTLRNGGIVNLIEYPAVSRNTCRWRLQVMAAHTHDQLQSFVDIATDARAAAQSELARQPVAAN